MKLRQRLPIGCIQPCLILLKFAREAGRLFNGIDGAWKTLAFLTKQSK